ncbi:MAG TPA: glycosyltransferase family 4 protein [Hyphomicrobiaceae bacterium]|jgi:glycosyltransferase involved in cell wall biosynthesis|nr:glycosyltransferase family 4 protein [Hyphomicrobiaceae bacterium]
MRIALFTTSFPSHRDDVRNAGVCVKDFAELLSQRGHEVVVLTPHKSGARADFAHQETVFFRWLGGAHSLSHINPKNPIGLLQLASVTLMGIVASLRLVRRFKPDHVLCFWAFPSGLWAYAARLFFRVPYSVWALGSDVWVVGKLPILRQALRLVTRASAHRYADGLALAGDLRAIAGRDVEFLPTSRVLSIPRDVVPGSGGYFLYLGRYHPNKGIDLLIEALATIKAELPANFHLLAHGSGPLEDQVRSRVRELGLEQRVTLAGPTRASQVELILRRAKGLIVPSRIESIPLVLGDAMQMELPVLVTDVGDMGKLVHEHRAGIVCRPEVDDLARALREFIRAPGRYRTASLRQLLDIERSSERFLSDLSGAKARVGTGP